MHNLVEGGFLENEEIFENILQSTEENENEFENTPGDTFKRYFALNCVVNVQTLN